VQAYRSQPDGIRRGGLAISPARNQDARAIIRRSYASRVSVIPSEVEGSRSITNRLLSGIPRLRFAPRGMTESQ